MNIEKRLQRAEAAVPARPDLDHMAQALRICFENGYLEYKAGRVRSTLPVPKYEQAAALVNRAIERREAEQ